MRSCSQLGCDAATSPEAHSAGFKLLLEALKKFLFILLGNSQCCSGIDVGVWCFIWGQGAHIMFQENPSLSEHPGVGQGYRVHPSQLWEVWEMH